MTRRCSGCQKDLPLESFTPAIRSKAREGGYCRRCAKRYQTAYNKLTPAEKTRRREVQKAAKMAKLLGRARRGKAMLAKESEADLRARLERAAARERGRVIGELTGDA